MYFKDPLHCVPISEPPRKRGRIDESTMARPAGSSTPSGLNDATDTEDALGTSNQGDAGENGVEVASAVKDQAHNIPLSNGEWSGSVSFIEWRGEVALLVAGYTPIVMAGLQARLLALAVMRKEAAGATDPDAANADNIEDDKLFNEFVSWTDPDGKRPIIPHLHFTRDHSVCSVLPSRAQLAMRQEYSLTTKEISGGLRLASFPVPVRHLRIVCTFLLLLLIGCGCGAFQLSNLSTATLTNVLQICGHSLFFHSVLLSAFSSTNSLFGERISPDNDAPVSGELSISIAQTI